MPEVDIHILQQEMFQEIVDVLQLYLPADWTKVCFYAQYPTEKNCGMKYYVRDEEGEFSDCFKLYDPQALVSGVFNPANKAIAKVRKHLPADKQWYALILEVDNEGEFNIKYDYADGVDHNDAEAMKKYYAKFHYEWCKKF